MGLRVIAGFILLAVFMPVGCAETPAAGHGVILAYHHVATDTPPSTSVTPATFAAHLDYLAEHQFHVWPLSKLLYHLDAGKPVPEDTVALTFDDAYASVFTEVLPRMKARGWPFTIFVSTDYIDKEFNGYMTWDQLREAARHGAELGNHSRAHPHLVRRGAEESGEAWRERIRAQIVTAQQRLAAETPAPVKIFAYPYGEYTRAVTEVVGDLGFYGVGQQSGAVGSAADLRAVPRFPMATGFAGLETFATKLNSRPLPVTVLAPEEPFLGGAPGRPALRLQLGEGPFRLDQLACYASGQGRMDMTWVDRKRRVVEVTPKQPLVGGGRYKYNCTAPGDDVYYWYSHLWMKRNKDGSWYRE